MPAKPPSAARAVTQSRIQALKVGRAVVWILVAMLLIVVAGVVYLMTADVPAPVTRVERVIPNDRLGSR